MTNPKTPAHSVLEAIKEYFSYDPETGVILWKKDMRSSKGLRAREGDIEGSLDNKGYYRIGIFRVQYRSHRVAWFLHHGVWPEERLDHRDLNRSNNRIDNLRLASRSQNQANIGALRNNTSGYKGVGKVKKRWQARILVNGKFMSLGCFDDPKEAHEAYCRAAELHFGEFARFEGASK